MAAVRWLLARGANAHQADRFGRSPLAEARKRARRPYPFSNYTEVLRLLEGHLDFADDVRRAEQLRLEGNALFGEAQFKRAAVRYSEALRLAVDARSWANRSQCYLCLARQQREGEEDFRCGARGSAFYADLFERALADAEAAIAMEPRQQPKAYYRAALALLGLGRVHRALAKLRAGVQSCGSPGQPGSVQQLEGMMDDLLQKLQMSGRERRQCYGESPGLGDLAVYTGGAPLSPGQVPRNMCMWCEKLLPPSLLPPSLLGGARAAGADRPVSVCHVTLSVSDDEEEEEEEEEEAEEAEEEEEEAEEEEEEEEEEEAKGASACPLCMCPIDDKLSPQLLRDKYLGGHLSPLCPQRPAVPPAPRSVQEPSAPKT